MPYIEGGTTHYGAFKVANSWGVGGWEQVPDGFYWISYAAMKQRVAICYFYYDMIGYNPTLEATFKIQHPLRSECNIQVGMGNPNSPISTKNFNLYINGGALPFCQNNIVFDISEFQNSMSNVNGQTFFLRVLDSGTSTTGTITAFSVNKQNSNDAPCQTLNQQAVYLNLTFGKSDWPMLHHDLQHTGTSPSTAPNTNNTLWSYTTGNSVASSPAIVGGVVYIGSDDGSVYALNALSGVKLWSFTTGDTVHSSPSVVDGVVYVGSWDDNVYALNATNGVKLWSYTTGNAIYSSSAVINGVVYIGSYDSIVYALNATTGVKLWSYTTGGEVHSSPAVVGGVVYIGSGDGNVYALNAITGVKLWSFTSGNYYYTSSPAVVGGVVYIGSFDGKVYALSATTGAKLWSYTTGNTVFASPAVRNGVVYIDSADGNVYALNAASGVKLWSYTTGSTDSSSPAVVDGIVFVGSSNDKVYALNATNGVKLWSYTTGDAVGSSPAVVDGKVYVGSNDGKLYCFGLPASIRLTGAGITTGGSGYTTPHVLLIGGGGTGATATARVSQGVIFGITLTNPGNGYTSPPTIIFRDPSPRAKGATATINYASP